MTKLLKSILCLMLVGIMVLGLAACGKKDEPKTNPTPDTSVNTPDNGSENPNETESDPTDVPSPTVDKQALYEELFKDPTKIEFATKNLVMAMTGGGAEISAIVSESGDMMSKMLLTKDTGYTMYLVGGEAYLELAVPETKDENGETTPAQRLYYKTTGMESYTPSEDSLEFNTDSLQETLEQGDRIVSITYIETKDFHGQLCDVIEVVMKQDGETAESLDGGSYVIVDDDRQDANLNEEEDKGEDAAPDDDPILTVGATDDGVAADGELPTITMYYYFRAEDQAFFGMTANDEEQGYDVEVYLPAVASVTLPQDVEWTTASEEEVGAAMMAIIFSMFASQMEAGE